jgi:hypothetical protein
MDCQLALVQRLPQLLCLKLLLLLLLLLLRLM